MEMITTKWYQENASRALNNFDNSELTLFNTYTSIVGKYSEFFDYMKKFYTHDLTEEKKEEVKRLAPKELGDMICYISTSLAITFNYTLDEIVEYIITNYSYERSTALPLYGQDGSYNIDLIHDYASIDKRINPFDLLMDYKKTLDELDQALDDPDIIVSVVAKILLKTSIVIETIFDSRLSSVLADNISKLQDRYTENFSVETANVGINCNKKYSEETDHKAVLQKAPSNPNNK